MGGLAGFIGTYIIGPRIGLFSQDERLSFILNDQFLDEDGNEIDMVDQKEAIEEQKSGD